MTVSNVLCWMLVDHEISPVRLLTSLTPQVPLDYKNHRNGHRASVPIIKYPASSKPYKGMVLTNPGGPGSSGIQFLLDTAEKTSKWIGGNYDYVAWEPRGLGFSVPAANCEEPLSTLASRGLISRIDGPEILEVVTALDVEQSVDVGNKCKSLIGGDNQAGPHMTTSVVVKDIISILDAFAKSKDGKKVKEPHLLNYWGISYGTYIGQTFASMFPDRVGRILLDAVLKPEEVVTNTQSTCLPC
jgi:pimeloyl-ACP methyl ester carboxylesterase